MLGSLGTGLSTEKEAERFPEAASRHVLTAEDARLFAAALEEPRASTPRARKAAALY